MEFKNLSVVYFYILLTTLQTASATIADSGVIKADKTLLNSEVAVQNGQELPTLLPFGETESNSSTNNSSNGTASRLQQHEVIHRCQTYNQTGMFYVT